MLLISCGADDDCSYVVRYNEARPSFVFEGSELKSAVYDTTTIVMDNCSCMLDANNNYRIYLKDLEILEFNGFTAIVEAYEEYPVYIWCD